MTRVRRGDPTANADIAMVGNAGDQAATITIDPSERENNPLLQEEDENWDLPEDQRAKGGQQAQRETQREPVEHQHEEEPDGEEDVRLAYDEEAEEESIRSGRRARRNRSRRGAIDQRDQIIEQMAGELQHQRQLLQGLYGGQFNLSARDIDQRISFHTAALERADIELARAVKESDGDAFALINKERDKVYRELFSLQNLRQGLEDRAREMQQGGGAEQPRQPQVDPRVQQAIREQESEFERMRDVFLDRYSWFDPERGNDADHRLVKRIDAEVTEDGYQRHTKAFWHEMERRMQREGFRPEPQARGSRREEEEDDVQPTRRTNGHANGGSFESRRSTPPTSAARSSRRPGNGGGYALSELEQDMLRDEGLLEPNLSEQDVAKRDRIIDKWRRGKASLRGGR
jgi:hypothetical protein